MGVIGMGAAGNCADLAIKTIAEAQRRSDRDRKCRMVMQHRVTENFMIIRAVQSESLSGMDVWATISPRPRVSRWKMFGRWLKCSEQASPGIIDRTIDWPCRILFVCRGLVTVAAEEYCLSKIEESDSPSPIRALRCEIDLTVVSIGLIILIFELAFKIGFLDLFSALALGSAAICFYFSWRFHRAKRMEAFMFFLTGGITFCIGNSIVSIIDIWSRR